MMTLLVKFLLFLIILIGESIAQVNVDSTEDFNKINRFYITLSGGLHLGEGRFITKPIVFFGAGFRINSGLNIKLEYTPIILTAKNNSSPYVYEGNVLTEGEEVLISEYYLTFEKSIIKKFWLVLGIAPETLFSIKIGAKYVMNFTESLELFAEYDLMLVGRPVANTPGQYFRDNAFLLGIHYSF